MSKELDKEFFRFLKDGDLPREEDQDYFNNITRRRLGEFQKVNGIVWLGKINRYGKETEDEIYEKYDGRSL